MPLFNRVPGPRRWLTPYHSSIVTTSATFTAGRVLLAEFELPWAATVDGISYVVGSTAAGNVTVGIYGPVAIGTDTALGSAVLAQSASTAQGTINSAQFVAFTAAVSLAPGLYWAALEGSDATGTYMRNGNQNQVPDATAWGEFYSRGGGYGALTDPCPATTATGGSIPGLRVRVSG